MSNYINSNSSIESRRTPLEDLAAELSVDVEALEERLEMVPIDPAACCVVNVGCPIKPL
jgi:hypothetical protein